MKRLFQNEKNKTLIIIIGCIILFATFFIYNGISTQNRCLEEKFASRVRETHHALALIESFALNSYKDRIETFLASHEGALQAFAEREREVLYYQVLPTYMAMRTENPYFQVVHFHLPDGTTLLRMHRPEMYGDNLKGIRPIIDAVHHGKKSLHGCEAGRHGFFFRIAMPVFHKDIYVGALEFGIAVDQIVETLIQNHDLIVKPFFLKEHYDKMTEIEKSSTRSFDRIVVAEAESLVSQMPQNFCFTEGEHPRLQLGQKHYIIHSHAIFKEFQGQPVGGLLLFEDITKDLGQKNMFIFKTTFLTLFFLAIVLVVLYFALERLLQSIARENVDRLEAERGLVQREAELNSIFQAAPVGIGVVVERNFIQVNERLCAMLGYRPEEIVGKSARMLYLTDSEFERVGAEKYRQISHRGTGTVETQFRSKDGRAVDVMLSSAPLEPGNLQAGVTFTALDVSSLKEVEKALSKSEKKYRLMMEAMKDLVYICGHDYLIEYMNPAMLKWVGRDAVGEKCFQALFDFNQPCDWCQLRSQPVGKCFEDEITDPKDQRSFLVSHLYRRK